MARRATTAFMALALAVCLMAHASGEPPPPAAPPLWRASASSLLPAGRAAPRAGDAALGSVHPS